MSPAPLELLEAANAYADPLAFVVLGLFLAGAALELRSRALARPVSVGAWVAFAVFWVAQIHYFAFVQKSIIEGVGSVIAVPASLYVGYLLWTGRDSLFVLSRAIAVMGVVFMPFEMSPVLRQWLIETVTSHTAFLMLLLGEDPTVVSGATVPGTDYAPYRNTFWFEPEASPTAVTYTIVIGCTGIGSMAIFAGLVSAVRAPLDRKLRAFAVSVPVIYVLNLIRNVFIATMFGQMRMQLVPELTGRLFGFDAAALPALVSYYWADRILAQTGSVIAMIVITWIVVRELPEILTVVEDVLYVFTGTEYDLGAALDVEVPDESDRRPRPADD